MSADTEALRDFLRRLSEWDVLNLAPGSGDDGPYWQGEITKTNAALDSLAAELEHLHQVPDVLRGNFASERANLEAEIEQERAAWRQRDKDAKAAEAELERVKAERDAQQRRIEDLEEGAWPWEWVIATRERERWKVAEARLDRALSALRVIDDHRRFPVSCDIARRAIAEIEGEA